MFDCCLLILLRHLVFLCFDLLTIGYWCCVTWLVTLLLFGVCVFVCLCYAFGFVYVWLLYLFVLVVVFAFLVCLLCICGFLVCCWLFCDCVCLLNWLLLRISWVCLWFVLLIWFDVDFVEYSWVFVFVCLMVTLWLWFGWFCLFVLCLFVILFGWFVGFGFVCGLLIWRLMVFVSCFCLCVC